MRICAKEKRCSSAENFARGGWDGDKNKWTGFRPMCLILE